MPVKYRKKTYRKRGVTINQVRNIVKVTQPPKQKRFANGQTLRTDLAIAVNANFMFSEISNISQGLTLITRTKNSVTATGLSLKMTTSDSSILDNRGLRIMVISPVSSNGDLDVALLSNLFENGTYGTQAYDKLSGSLINPINKDFFKVYYDKVIRVTRKGEAQGNTYFDKYIKFNHKILYDDVAGLAADPKFGKLYLVVTMNEFDNTPSDAELLVNYMATVYFRDSWQAVGLQGVGAGARTFGTQTPRRIRVGR